MSIVKKRGKSCTYEYDDELFAIRAIHGRSRLVYIGAETDGAKIKIPEGIHDIGFMFSRTAVTSVPKIPASVVYAENAFRKCPQLKEADVHAPGLKYAPHMFYGCRALESASMKHAPNITDATAAFAGCKSLKEFSAWPEMLSIGCRMFYGCEQLAKLPSFNAKAVSLKDAEEMCMGCHSLYAVAGSPKELKRAKRMFQDSALTKALNLSMCENLDDISGIYCGCQFLYTPGKLPPHVATAVNAYKNTAIFRTPDLSVCTELTHTKGMFEGCLNLAKSSKLPASLEHTASMYRDCPALTVQPAIGHTNITDMAHMFEGTSIASPRELPPHVINAAYAYACTPVKVTPVNFPGHATLSNTVHMFEDCRNLHGICGYPDTLQEAEAMCKGCINLKCVASLAHCPNVVSAPEMFCGCTGLDSSDLPDLMSAALDCIQDYEGMFAGTPHPGLSWDGDTRLRVLYKRKDGVDPWP